MLQPGVVSIEDKMSQKTILVSSTGVAVECRYRLSLMVSHFIILPYRSFAIIIIMAVRCQLYFCLTAMVGEVIII